MMGHIDFFDDRVKIEKGTLNEGVPRKTQGLDLGSSLWEE